VLGTEKEENKPLGSSSSTLACLQDHVREKITQNLLSSCILLDVVLQPAPSPQVLVPTTAAASHNPWTVQASILSRD